MVNNERAVPSHHRPVLNAMMTYYLFWGYRVGAEGSGEKNLSAFGFFEPFL